MRDHVVEKPYKCIERKIFFLFFFEYNFRSSGKMGQSTKLASMFEKYALILLKGWHNLVMCGELYMKSVCKYHFD